MKTFEIGDLVWAWNSYQESWLEATVIGLDPYGRIHDDLFYRWHVRFIDRWTDDWLTRGLIRGSEEHAAIVLAI